MQKEKDKLNSKHDSAGDQEGGDDYQKFASSIMGNINYFGKSLKVSSIFGGHKSERSERTMKQSEKEKKAQTMRIPKVLAQNIIFNTISNFMYHFVNFKYSLENSKQVVLYFCKRYELDQSRTHLLLSELESA